MTKRYFWLIGSLLLVIFGVVIGYSLFHPKSSKEVTAQTVVTSLQSEGFLVTESYIANQQVNITHSTGSDFKDIFWKQAIKASANVKVNMGVDLGQLTQNNVQVNDKQITVRLPPVKINSTEILGDVLLQNNQGIFKKIFDSNDGYNEAVSELKNQVEQAAQNMEIQNDAKENTVRQIKYLLEYIAPDKEIVVIFN